MTASPPGPSQSFGADAGLYDRARPPYPAAAVDLVPSAGLRVVEVGCGTGILSRALLARGCDLVAVEPDARMAAVARVHGVTVEEATFEAWDAGGRVFDLLVSAMAWHWVDPDAGAAKAADVLRPGGAFAALWSHIGLPAEVRAALLPAYERHAPTLPDTAMVLSASAAPRSGPDRDAEALVATGRFTAPWREEVPWAHRYTTSSWVDELATRSSHRMLAQDVREALLADVAAAIDALGGSFDVEYTTTLLRAERR